MSHEHYVESLLQEDPQEDDNFYPHHHHHPHHSHSQTTSTTSTSTAIPESPMQKFRIEISKFRSSSAPPSVEELQPTTPLSEEDQYRSDPDYYAFYYSKRLLNPRLPPPVAPSNIDHTSWQQSHTQHAHFSDMNGRNSEGNTSATSPKSPGDNRWTNLSGSGSSSAVGAVKRSSLVDRIQEDFPRTPSPVLMSYPKSPQHPGQAMNQQPKSILQRPLSLNRNNGNNNDGNNNNNSNNNNVGFFSSNAANEEEAVLVNRMHNLSIANHEHESKIHQPRPQYSQQQQQQYSRSQQYHHDQRNQEAEIEEEGQMYEDPSERYSQQSRHHYQRHHPSQHYGDPHPMMGSYPPPAPYGYGSNSSIPMAYAGQFLPGYAPPPPQYMQPPLQHRGAMHHGQRKMLGPYPPMSIAVPPYAAPALDEYYRGQPDWPAPHMYGAAPPLPFPHPMHSTRHQPRHHQKPYVGRGGHRGKPYRSYNNHVSNDTYIPQSELMEEFKAGRGSRDLLDIKDHVIEFSRDQHGSRFIQQKLELASDQEKDMVFQEILPEAVVLTTDVFGNYVIQKLFEYGSHAQRKLLCSKLKDDILFLTRQTYGCRVIQKALEFVDNGDRAMICNELSNHVMECVQDQNGNHVIQKCIETVPSDIVQFIVDSFKGNVQLQATHPYGCRVIQRILEHCSEKQTKQIFDEILSSVFFLAQDPYGNYVVQHVLEKGHTKYKSAIIRHLRGKLELLSQNKFASNVVEKCFQNGSKKERNNMIDEILSSASKAHDFTDSALYNMIKDQYANYVVQRIIELADDSQRKMIFDVIHPHANLIRKSTYGKHILSVVEKYPSW